MCLIRSMFETHVVPPRRIEPLMDLKGVMNAISSSSARPRYTFMVLDLIARVAGPSGQAGPYIRDREEVTSIREWLANAIAPTAARHHHRRATIMAVEKELTARGLLPDDQPLARQLIEAEVASRIKASGMTAVSRAVSELVRAGLVKRHYQGYRVDHENRGAQRLAVYTVPPGVRAALQRGCTL